MALPNFPTLVKRLVKGSQVTHAEGDANLDAIKSYCEMLASLFGVALNPDGTLNADAVTTISILNRQVTEAKLGPVSVFPTKQDTGSTNALKIALIPPLTAYADGQTFFVKVVNANTGPATVNVDNIGAVSIKKRGVVDLEAGDYEAGSVIVVTYFGGSFHLVSGSGSSSSSSSSAAGFSGFQLYESADVVVPPASPVAASGTINGTANVADGDTVTIDSGGNQRIYRFKNVMAAAYDVQRDGASLATSLANLKAAIDASGTPGVEYFAGTLEHPTVSGSTLTANSLVVVADTAGIGGNAIVTTETSAVLSWAAAALTGGITDSFTNFTHGLPNKPGIYGAYLVCISTDLGFAVGTEINTVEFTDSTGMPAFSVSADATNVRVERYPATIELGDAGAIDEAKWSMRVRASIVISAAASVFPAVTFAVKQPLGAFANGNDLFLCQYGGNNGGITYIQRLALSSNNIELLERDTGTTNPQNIAAAPFKRVDGTNHFVFTSTTGVYSLPMLEPTSGWKPVILTTGSAWGQRPVHIVESGGAITEVYAVTSAYGVNFVSGIQAYLVVTGTGSVSAYGSNLDLTSALILSADGTAGNVEFRRWHQAGSAASVLHFQYNKTKKRIYVVTNEDHCLHIFKINSSVDWKTWWDLAAAARYADLQYVKTIGIGGDGAPYGDAGKDRIYIDIDLETGAERAIVTSRYGNTALSGSVTRIPWKE